MGSCSTKVATGDGGYRFNGVKTFVAFANSADVLVCAAGDPVGGGVTLCMVSPNADGVSIEPLASIGGYPTSEGGIQRR